MTYKDFKRLHHALNDGLDFQPKGLVVAVTVDDAYGIMAAVGDWLFGRERWWPEVGRRGSVLGIDFVVVPDPPPRVDPPALDIDHD